MWCDDESRMKDGRFELYTVLVWRVSHEVPEAGTVLE